MSRLHQVIQMGEVQEHLHYYIEDYAYTYLKKQEILPTLKSENIICILLEGFAQIVNISYNGEEVVVENIYEENIFGSNISDINNEEIKPINKNLNPSFTLISLP